MKNEEAIGVLNDLIENCKDGEYGFRACAEHTKRDDIRSLLLQRADECALAARELQAHVTELGGRPDDRGTAAGALHRGWVAVRGTLSGYTDLAMLEECERGEDAAVARYRRALEKQDLPANLRATVQRQYEGALRHHDQVRNLRNSLRTTA
ncbi:PA2169 family four-helix-bundle protein [Caldimonas sp. KR1-144]|uniref:PA2169 family four-helix-bundle protein n=1 Tax=Caldimonas sp. KR1-144 TaxID=3400911 RepID=UPI003C091B2F